MNPPHLPLTPSVPEPRSPLDHTDTVIPLAPQPFPTPFRTPEHSDLWRADLLLASFVVLLAFFVASTPARNSDLWLHLATGRALADGSYRFQGDPFAQDAHSWIAHSWLYDLLTYEIFTTFPTLGGTVLVILKASLVALLAGLLIRLGARARGLAWPALAATLSVLTLSGRLLLQPALVSAVLLAVTLALLERGRRMRGDHRASRLSAYGPICLLFALWANLDDWFLLGPLTVGLYLFGEVVAAVIGDRDKNRADLTGLALTLGVGLLACLLTPFHVHGFTVPVELGLSATAHALEADPVLRNLFVSPFDGTYFHSGRAWSISGLAYLALVLLSGLSFLGSRDAWRSWRLPVWLGFFALSAWSVRAVPFFAVAAGPILALNVQDLARRFQSTWLGRNEFFLARLGRAAALLLLLGLLVAAWPGWLQGAPYEMRRWIVLDDPSLRQAAQRISAWRADGKLSEDDRGFDFAPEVANYFAWFCPAEKSLVDVRLQAPPAAAADYVTVRQYLLNDTTPKTGWRRILRAYRINHVILYDNNHERMQAIYRRLLQHSEEWFLMALKGRTAIFGWRDPQKKVAAPEKLRLHLLEKAYRPSADEKAPGAWPGRGPESPSWWRAFDKTRPAGTLDRDEAALLLTQFDVLRAPTLVSRSHAWDAGRLVGAIGMGGARLPVRLQQTLDLYGLQVLYEKLPLDSQGRLTGLAQFVLALRANYFQTEDDAPPEYLWLAIRAARRALRQDPDDAHAYLILGEAYLRLAQATRERAPTLHLPLLERLHELQASVAFHQALLVDQDLIAAHAGLAVLYQGGGQWDLQLRHLREVLRLTEANGRRPGESPADRQQRLGRLKNEVQQVQDKVERILNRFEVTAVNLKIRDRAEAAQALGLGGKALEILLAADVASFGQRAVQMELELLFVSGRVRDVREWMLPELKETLGPENYGLFRLLLAATCGDYDRADAELVELNALYEPQMRLNNMNLSLRQSIALGIGRAILEGRQGDSLQQFLGAISSDGLLLRKQAEAHVLRGLFALERGDTTRARDFMSAALKIYRSEKAVRTGGGLDFFGRRLAEHYWNLLSERERGRVTFR